LIPKEHSGLTVWFTGLSSAGKTTIANEVRRRLLIHGIRNEVLDGDSLRQHLCSDLGFSKLDRDTNVRRIAFVADLLTRNGVVALVAAISPYREVRDEVRSKISRFAEVYVTAPLEVCEQRDIKGLYRKARRGEIQDFTGINDPYEPPLSAALECQTHVESVEDCASKVVQLILNALNQS
jgi:adenylylsulfate kinase